MIFKELIDQLKKVKTENDISGELANEIIVAGIAMLMSEQAKENPDSDPLDDFIETRTIVLTLFDGVLQNILNEVEEDDDDEFPDFNGMHAENSPMSDPQFKADMEKAIIAYNKRIGGNLRKV